jgi:hypothetical protein
MSGVLHRLAYAAVYVALIVGICTVDAPISQIVKEARPYLLLGAGLLAVALLARLLRANAAYALIGASALLTLQFVSMTTLIAAAAFFLAAALVGRRMLLPLQPQSALVSTLAGVLLFTGVIGWLLPLHIHLRVVYTLVLAAIFWFERAHARALLVEVRNEFKAAVFAAPITASLAILVACLSLTTAWLPTIQFDDLAYHSMLPAQLLKLGYYRFDASTQVWAAAPWGADLVHSIVGVLANEESRSAVNLSWFLFSTCAMWAMGRLVGLAPRWRWLAIALYASQPYVSGLLGSSQVENELIAGTLALGTVAIRLIRDRDHDSACVVLLFCGLFASLKASQALVLIPLIAVAIPRMIRGDLKKMTWFLFVGLILGSSSYVYSTFLTGNPLLPLFNGIFKSNYFPAVDFHDLRWTQGLHWRSVWDLTFATHKYQENYIGGAGVSLLVLTVPLLGALFFKSIRLVTVWVIVASLMMFWTIQYLRYIAPLLILMIPLALYVVQAHSVRWATAATILALTILNVLLIPTTSYILKNSPLTLQLSSLLTTNPSMANRAIVEQYAFETNLEKYLASAESGEYGLYLADRARPFTAPFAGQAFAPNWYDFAFQAAANAADEDITGQRWIRLLSQAGIKYVLAKTDLSAQPALEEALRGEATKTLAFQSHALYCFCRPGFVNPTLPLYHARDLSRWLTSAFTRPNGLPRSPRRVVPGQSLLQDEATAVSPLRLVPGRSTDCGKTTPATVTVEWDARALTDTGVTIATLQPGRRWKTWRRDLSQGVATAAEPAEPGMTYVLLNGNGNRVLGQAAYGWTPCLR